MANGTSIAFCFAVIISAVYCIFVQTPSESYFYFELENGTIIKEDLTRMVAKPQAFNPNSVSFYLYTKKTGTEKPCRLTSDSCKNWINCGFDSSKDTVIIIHGYIASYAAEGIQKIKNAYGAKKDVNVIIVDFSPINAPYLLAVWSAKNIGQTAASVIVFLENNCGVDPEGIECVGHSLGSHICGLLCAALPHKCSRIVALDPAYPIISGYSKDERLDKSDTDNLQIFHTSSSGLGDTSAYGHIDFYPNGAVNQYGCNPWSIWQLLGSCDHMKACDLYADTILHPNSFKTDLQCISADVAMSGNCQQAPILTHLGDPNNRWDRGIFHIHTNPIYEKLSAH